MGCGGSKEDPNAAVAANFFPSEDNAKAAAPTPSRDRETATSGGAARATSSSGEATKPNRDRPRSAMKAVANQAAHDPSSPNNNSAKPASAGSPSHAAAPPPGVSPPPQHLASPPDTVKSTNTNGSKKRSGNQTKSTGFVAPVASTSFAMAVMQSHQQLQNQQQQPHQQQPPTIQETPQRTPPPPAVMKSPPQEFYSPIQQYANAAARENRELKEQQEQQQQQQEKQRQKQQQKPEQRKVKNDEQRHYYNESKYRPTPEQKQQTTTTTNIITPTSSKSASTKRQQQAPIQLAEDDFSVAPSLDFECRNVTKVEFQDVYKRGKKLGYGAFAQVFLAAHRPTGKEYAIKQVDRSKMFWGERDALKDEIDTLKKVREGPNIVQLYEVYEETDYCYLVMECMLGGELFDRIIEKKTFSEAEARECCRCILSALQYMHERRVAHRDLKPENLLLAAPKALLPVKLADFGFAKTLEKRNGCRTLCGTPGYLAPEILERWPAYDVRCDVWSVGVILFLLLGGYLPFDDEEEDKVFDRTRNGQYDFRPQFWKHISPGAKDLVAQCLTINPMKRIDATQALQHEWMAQSKTQELETKKLNVDKLKNLIRGKRKIKAAINTLMAANRLKQLNDDFSTYLDKRRKDSVVSHFSYMTGGTRGTLATVQFKPDGPSGKPFSNFYIIGAMLGEGGFAKVHRCIRKKTRVSYAVKEIDKKQLDTKSKASLKDEISALKLLRGGPHIIRLLDIFDEPKSLYLVLEEMKGGHLLSRIVSKEVYTEREARQVCKILFSALDYCHKKQIAHRDVKPENLLLVDEGDDTSIKIADFGFAKRVTHANCLSTLCGTAQYVAPEIVDSRIDGYDHRVDMWSAGVVAYVLIGGYSPFDGPLEDLAQDIIQGRYEFHEEFWRTISKGAQDMIVGLMTVDPSRRLTAEAALNCPWMEIEEEMLSMKDLSSAQEMIRKNLQPAEKVKMAVNAIMTTNKWMSLAGIVSGTKRGVHDEESVAEANRDFNSEYTWGEQIGVGTFSVVHESRKRTTNELFAVKRISRNDLHPSDAVALHDEIAALKSVKACDQIVKLYKVFDETDFTFLVLECMKGGDLIDRIIEKRHYTEFDAREVSRKLILGVAYCHQRKIANRNLKPENLLLQEGSDTDVKISDFGYAKTVHFPNSLRTQCGTEGYVAPEIIAHRPAYDVPCDMWSVGVIIYIVLGGYRPFRGEGEEVMRMIRYGEYKFHKKYWSHVSDDAKNLIRSMLTVDPERRITAEQALQSPWIRADTSAFGTTDLSRNMEDLKVLRQAKAKVKGAVNTIIASNKLQSIGGLRAYQDF